MNSKLQGVLLSIITTAVIGCFTFLWNLNSTIASMRAENQNRTETIQNVQQGVNDLRLDMKDTKKDVQGVKESVIRLEEQKKKRDSP